MTERPDDRSAPSRALAWLLLAYPRAFRDRFDSGLRDALVHEREVARASGARALMIFWLTAAIDAGRFGLAERLDGRRQNRARPPRRSLGVLMSSFSAGLRDAWRSLRAAPVVTVIAVLSLALGIGANTALFTILNSLLLKSLPVSEPARLVIIDKGTWTNPIWEQIRDRQTRIFDGAFAWCSARFDLATRGESEFVSGAYASGNMFEVLGIHPILGRTLTPADDVRGGGPDGAVVVLSHEFWKRHFNGAADVVGRPLTLQRKTFTIVGVLPEGFLGPEVGTAGDVIIPVAADAVIRGKATLLDQRSTWWLDIIGRLKPGQSLEQAEQALRGEQPQIREATIPQRWRKVEQDRYLATPFTLLPAATGESSLRERFERPLTILLVVVGLVLVIACANIANLLIARATARRHELSVRLALGASRWRIATQLLLESVILACAGAAAGLLVAGSVSRLLVHQLSSGPTGVQLDLTLDWRVLAFTAGVGLATAMLFGIAPAFGVGRIAPAEALRERGRGNTGDSRFSARNFLVVAQVALSLALVVAAGLFVHTFAALTTRYVGFTPDPLLIVGVDTQRSQVTPEGRVAFFERLRDAAASVPGVAGVAVSIVTPIGDVSWNEGISTAGGQVLSEDDKLAWKNAITPGWFSTYGMQFKGGRDFDTRDRAGAPAVAVVNESFAKRFFPGVNPIGQRFDQVGSSTTESFEVVGVVADAAYNSLRVDPGPTEYVPLAQHPEQDPQQFLTVRATAGAPAQLSRPIAAALEAIDGGIALTFRPLVDQLGASLDQERLVALLAGFFGALALLLAGLGLYGVTAYAVSRRRAEIGIRLALGATRTGIVQLVLRRVGWLVGAGIVAGAALSLWLSKYVAMLLYGVTSRDPWTLIGAAAVLGAVGLLAGWLPAQRASRVDPTVALRTD